MDEQLGKRVPLAGIRSRLQSPRLWALLSLTILVLPTTAAQSPEQQPNNARVQQRIDAELGRLEEAARNRQREAAYRVKSAAGRQELEEQAAELSEILDAITRELEIRGWSGESELGSAYKQRLTRLSGWAFNLRRSAETGLAPPLTLFSTRGAGAAISGRSTEASDGTPISSTQVSLYDDNGFFRGSEQTGAQGYYSLGGLAPGSYFLWARKDQYIAELFDELTCPVTSFSSPSCTIIDGSPVLVTAVGTVTDVDFTLDLGGSISGRLTDEQTGLPISGRVTIYDAHGTQIASVSADFQGFYEASGLEAGTVYAVATSGSFLDELYEDLPCDDCDPTTGTPITVQIGMTTPDIDFQLQAQGSIGGTVSDDSNGEGVSFARIEVYDSDGNFVTLDTANGNGEYLVGRLDPGTYFVRTASGSFGEFSDELYDNLPCPSGCDPTEGTPIPVALGEPTTGIDFSLSKKSSLSGRLLEATTGLPVEQSVSVTLYTPQGGSVGSDFTSSGSFLIERIAPGTYFLFADSLRTHRDQIYNGVPCTAAPPGGCDLSLGAAIVVGIEQSLTGFDFFLDRLGTLYGTVTSSATGLPVPFPRVGLWEAGGASSVQTAVANSSGSYSLNGVEPGTYFLTASGQDGFQTQLHAGIPCGIGFTPSCDPSTGTPLVLDLNDTVQVDFSLLPLAIFIDSLETGDLRRWESSVPTQ